MRGAGLRPGSECPQDRKAPTRRNRSFTNLPSRKGLSTPTPCGTASWISGVSLEEWVGLRAQPRARRAGAWPAGLPCGRRAGLWQHRPGLRLPGAARDHP